MTLSNLIVYKSWEEKCSAVNDDDNDDDEDNDIIVVVNGLPNSRISISVVCITEINCLNVLELVQWNYTVAINNF